MKIRLALAALVLGTLGATTVLTSAIAEESLDGKAAVEAQLDAKSKKLTVTLKGKESGIYVNKEYPVKCSLKIKDGGKLSKAEVTKDDLKYEDVSGEPTKAKTAKFVVDADKQVDGECKMVVCTKSACSAPQKVTFSAK